MATQMEKPGRRAYGSGAGAGRQYFLEVEQQGRAGAGNQAVVFGHDLQRAAEIFNRHLILLRANREFPLP